MSALRSTPDDWTDITDDQQRRGPRIQPRPAAEPAPTFFELDDAQCHAILDRNRVGRIAYSFHDRVDIAPVHFVRRGPWLYGRSAPGSKLTTLAHVPWVAFEVDEIEGLFDWRSVVVHGAFYCLMPGGTSYDVSAWEAGLDALRELVPGSFTRDDPVPFRLAMFRISVDQVTGRSARSGSLAGK